MTILGVDTSNHDIIDRNGGRNLDWAAIARAGVTFCWHKVSDGLNFYADPTAAMALTSMRAALPIWGGYHVLWGNRSITGQLDWFASILDRTTPGWRADPRFVAVWDCEPFGYNITPSIDQVNQAGDYWLKATGRPSLAYCPPWVYGADLNRLRYPLISSAYGKNDPGPLGDLYPGDGTSRWQATPQRQADVLQYGSRTVVGPHSDMDADAFRGTLDQLIALFGGTDMAIKDDPDAYAEAWRVEALTHGRPTVLDGPTKGEPVELVQILTRLDGRNALGEIYNRIMSGRSDTDPNYSNPNNLTAFAAKLDAYAAADATRDQAMLAAIQTVSKGGSNVDTSAVVTAVNAVRDEARQQFAALHAENAALKAELDAARAREAAAVKAASDALNAG